MRVMVYDTETTGLPLWSSPSEDPGQPRLVQLTAVLFDGSLENELEYFSAIVRPDGWTIPDEVAKLHRITTEIALVQGIPLGNVISQFVTMAFKADLVCAYGIDFDMRIIRIAMLRSGNSKQTCDDFTNRLKTHCVMRQATPLARVPPTDKMMRAGRKTWKTPNLQEAVKAILGEDLEEAHDSRADVLATARLYWRMNARKAPL